MPAPSRRPRKARQKQTRLGGIEYAARDEGIRPTVACNRVFIGHHADIVRPWRLFDATAETRLARSLVRFSWRTRRVF
jgi:hypothetical protein